MNPTLVKPKRVHKAAQERESELLAAATRVFAQFGYQKADVQLMADDAGVGKGTVYRYFASKEILFRACLKYNVDALRERMIAARSGPGDPLEKLRRSVRTYLLFFENNPDVTELFVQERAEFRENFRSSYFLYADDDMNVWNNLFRQIAAVHPLRVPISHAMEVCGDLLHGAVLLNHTPLPRQALSQRVGALFDIYLNGILQQQ